MKKDIVISGVVGLLLGVLIGVYLVPQQLSDRTRGNMMGGQFGEQNQIDQHFIEEMIPHHQGAIDMAKLALEKAKNPLVKTLANNIIDSQNKEIVQMKQWYQEWFGKEYPLDSDSMMGGMNHGTSMGMHMSGMEGDMEKLKASTNFDLEFITQMIPHHEMAVMMARMLDVSTNRTEMNKFANEIINAQTKEIDMMKQWQKDWK